MAILNDHDRIEVKRQCFAILQSPQGRDLGRIFLVERGKEKGNLRALKEEIFDILSGCINDLYTSPPPVQSVPSPLQAR